MLLEFVLLIIPLSPHSWYCDALFMLLKLCYKFSALKNFLGKRNFLWENQKIKKQLIFRLKLEKFLALFFVCFSYPTCLLHSMCTVIPKFPCIKEGDPRKEQNDTFPLPLVPPVPAVEAGHLKQAN